MRTLVHGCPGGGQSRTLHEAWLEAWALDPSVSPVKGGSWGSASLPPGAGPSLPCQQGLSMSEISTQSQRGSRPCAGPHPGIGAFPLPSSRVLGSSFFLFFVTVTVSVVKILALHLTICLALIFTLWIILEIVVWWLFWCWTESGSWLGEQGS